MTTAPDDHVRSPVDRRSFLVTVAGVSTASVLHAPRLDAKDDELAENRVAPPQRVLRHVDPRVQIVARTLPAGDNAFAYWHGPAAKLQPLPVFAEEFLGDGKPLSETTIDGLLRAAESRYPFPTGTQGDCIRAWLNDHVDVFKLIDQGLQCEGYQVPVDHLVSFLQVSTDVTAAPRALASFMLTYANQSISDGNWDEVARYVAKAAQFGRMLQENDGILIHYLIGLGVHHVVHDFIRGIAASPAAPNDARQRLSDIVRRNRPDPQGWAKAIRIEFVYFYLPLLERIPRQAPLPELVDGLLNAMLLLGEDVDDAIVDADDAARIRQGIMKLLAHHPNPFDSAATVRMLSQRIATTLAAEDGRDERSERWLAEVECWPPSLWPFPDFLLDVDHEEAHRSPSDAELAVAQRKLAGVANPIGKILLHMWMPILRLKPLQRATASSDATRVLLACRAFEEAEDRLPIALAELVDRSYLPRVPQDPCGSGPLRYDACRRILWSVGTDGIDGGGDGDPDAEFPDGEDIVWRVGVRRR